MNQIEELKKQIADLQSQIDSLNNARPNQRTIFPDSTATVGNVNLTGFYEVFPGHYVPFYI